MHPNLVAPPNPALGSATGDEFWNGFRDYLMSNMSKQAAKTRVATARRYCHVLQSGNAQELLSLTFHGRTNVMRSLAILSKYTGSYARWRAIKEAHALKWSNETDGGIRLFMQMANSTENYTSMMKWLKDAIAKLPERYGQTLVYCTLTGLRAGECCRSLQLLRAGAGPVVGIFFGHVMLGLGLAKGIASAKTRVVQTTNKL